MKYITVLGAGLLVGTALAVIIPEGVHTLYMSGKQGKSKEQDQRSLRIGLRSQIEVFI